jgi:hypothetical protein
MKTEFNTSFPWLDCQYDGAPSKVIFSGGGVRLLDAHQAGRRGKDNDFGIAQQAGTA